MEAPQGHSSSVKHAFSYSHSSTSPDPLPFANCSTPTPTWVLGSVPYLAFPAILTYLLKKKNYVGTLL